ncbi:early light-induced protein, chloroplastic-like [Arachis stenosperma]|uniref:early light-induced protein, chloroplastic-like n=1 Tax=Arachis stenosperma TaxID=217475 RepID=UPI0025AB7CD2|nr:early light-induced protein, chloroplastic-like [Arachis stenosperma]
MAAASSYAMQSSILACPVTNISNRFRVNQFGIPSLRRKASLVVRSMAEEEQAPNPVTPPAPSQKVSSKLIDIMAFSGAAPERINGRLAMIGFVVALAMEVTKGEGVFVQISNGGITWFLGTSVILSLASLVPLLRGVSVESKSKAFMSSDAELWNGRFAMLGLVALAFTEYIKGSTSTLV